MILERLCTIENITAQETKDMLPEFKLAQQDLYKFRCEYEEELKRMSVYHAKQADIDSMEYPDDMEMLHIYGDYFDRLTVPNGVNNLICHNLGLKELHLPDSLENAYILQNKLTHLELPENVFLIDASNNMLNEITFRKPPMKLFELDLHENRLISLDFVPPKSLCTLIVKQNPLVYINPELFDIAIASDGIQT